METLKFVVYEQYGRTFELPMEKAIAIIQEDNKGDVAKNWNSEAIATELYNNFSDYLADYEKENGYCESTVAEVQVKHNLEP